MKRFTLLFSTIYDTFLAIVCMSARKISVDLLRLKNTGIMLDQMQYLTLSTVKPFKLITYAC